MKPHTDFDGRKLNVRRGATHNGLSILLATTCFPCCVLLGDFKGRRVVPTNSLGQSGEVSSGCVADDHFVESIEDSKSSTVQNADRNMALERRQNKFRQSLDPTLIRARGDSVCRLALTINLSRNTRSTRTFRWLQPRELLAYRRH